MRFQTSVAFAALIGPRDMFAGISTADAILRYFDPTKDGFCGPGKSKAATSAWCSGVLKLAALGRKTFMCWFWKLSSDDVLKDMSAATRTTLQMTIALRI